MREIVSGKFTNPEDREIKTMRMQLRYTNLIERLGELGTNVIFHRTILTDRTIEPRNFIKDSFHEFIFPPQQDVVLDNNVTQDIEQANDSDLSQSSRIESKTYRYQSGRVVSRVGVRYEDAGDEARMKVIFIQGEEDLTLDAAVAIHNATQPEDASE